MAGEDDIPTFRDLPFQDLANYWRERWLSGRASRVDGWRAWRRSEIEDMLIIAKSEHEEMEKKDV
ncbi:hypothetical protein DRQ12_07325 [candidate division KSB1 bacterium]|nr:MAG: hypothetical protein DRQ12_07325 [candidate division KSB1 bacterium]